MTETRNTHTHIHLITIIAASLTKSPATQEWPTVRSPQIISG